mgnify:CR=1 FL=1
MQEELKLLRARLFDAVQCASLRSIPKFVGFLNAAEALEALKVARETGAKWLLFGGYEDAERVMLGCFPEWDTEKQFPIEAITFSYLIILAMRL